EVQNRTRCAPGRLVRRAILAKSGTKPYTKPKTTRRIRVDAIRDQDSKRDQMNAFQTRPLVLQPRGAIEPCSRCDARSRSVCNAIPDTELRRLGEAATTHTVASGSTFVTEGEPASAFFNITGGSAKLYKLLPDGRRQITGFVGVGHFLGLAVSATYAF